MTQTATQSDQAILQLLANVSKQPTPAPEEADVTDYDWNSPCRFTSSQLGHLQRLARSAAGEMSAALCAQILDDVELQPAPPIQRYTEQLLSKEDDTKKYYVSLGTESAPRCGFVMIQAERASQWVSKVLGGAATEEKDLSSLESAILIDIVESLVAAFNRQFQTAGGRALRCGNDVCSSPNLSPDLPAEEYTILPFRMSGDADQNEVQLMLVSDVLAPAAGADSKPTSAKSPEQIRKDIIACIEQVDIGADVLLGKVELILRDIMSLESGDVLLMDTEVGQTVVLTVNGTTVLYGYPVRCAGRYGLQIVGRAISHNELK